MPGTGETLSHVRYSGSVLAVPTWEFDVVPCRMRLSMPGSSRLVHPVPGRPNGVDRNTDILVWCECMAQTWDQLQLAREVREREIDPDTVAWPAPRQQRGWDVLGAVSTVVLGTSIAASSRGRISNPHSAREARTMWLEHVAERERRIAERNRND